MFRFPNGRFSNLLGEIDFIHNGKREDSSAFELKEKAEIRLKLPVASAALSVTLEVFEEDGVPIFSEKFLWTGRKKGYEFYRAPLKTDTLGVGLYLFGITLNTPWGLRFIRRTGYGRISVSEERYEQFQFSVCNFLSEENREQLGGIVYEIFTDRFSRGKGIIEKNGALYPESFEFIPEYPDFAGAPLKNNTYFGGNLYGICEKLSYISSLGVSIIYLTPIFESPSNHKYDTADYMSVDAGFGGDAALKKLISEAKKYGIRIILDGVFNHTGADSIYFNKYSHYGDGGAYNSKSSLYYEWYDFKSYPHLYESWWGIEILPRIKTGSESFHKFIAGEGGVVEKYMKLGILGFRLDVVDELEDGFVEDIKSRQNEISKDNLLFGEVWEDASNKIAYGRRKRYFLGAELDGVMNYPLCRGITDFVRGEGISALEYALFEVYRNAPKRISNTQMNLLGSHDTPRILTVLSDGYNPNRDNSTLSAVRLSENEKRIGKERLKLAYALISTLPGLPMIYYGDEAGVEGYSDPFNRLPFPWEKRDRELVEFFKKIGMIRRKNNVYKDGNLKIIALDKEILIFARLNKKYAYITVAVVGDTEVKIKFSEHSQNILDDSASLMYNLNKNSVAIFKTSSKVAMYFKKGKL